MSPVFEGTLSV